MVFGLPAFFTRGEGAEGAEARGKRRVSFFFSQRRRGSRRTQRAAGSLKADGQLLTPLYFEIFRFKRNEKVTRYLQASRLPLRLCVPLRSLREKKGASFFFSQRRRGSRRTQRAAGSLKADGQLLAFAALKSFYLR